MDTVTMPTSQVDILSISDLDTSPTSSPALRPKAARPAGTSPTNHISKARCILLEPDNLPSSLPNAVPSPLFVVNDGATLGPEVAQPSSLPSSSPLSITDIGQSPWHASGTGASPNHLCTSTRHSVSPIQGFTEEEVSSPILCPSSPLFSAVREAVDSLSQYEDFDVQEKIGSGFFADVYKVYHAATQQAMVLKVNKKLSGLKTMKEVELLKRLSHPNILHYVGACVYKGQLHALTEYVNGGALEQLIQATDIEFPWSMRLKLSLGIARGMAYLHDNDMLHRDLNSKNVLLRRQGSKYTAVVADFGLAAKNPHTVRTMTRTLSVVGTPYWMAPEVLVGKPYDGAADVFSYGIVLCEIVSRLEADPDEIPRNNDFSLNSEKFGRLPSVADCPQEFMELAFVCCRRLPIERPNFSDIVTRVTVISDLRNGSREGGGEEPNPEDSLITPQPSCRLSFHEPGRRSASPPAFGGPISPSPLLISEHKASTTPLVSGHKSPSPPRMLGVNSSSPLTLSVAHKSVGFKPVAGQETAV